MTTPRPLSTAIRNEVLAACRTALHYRGDLKSLMLGAGVPAAVYNRYDHLENTKVKIARSILDELQELGPNGWAVQRRIVTELCGMQRPANGVEDLTAGRNALDALRRTAAHEGVIVDTIHEARHQAAAIVINPGALTHTSVAILDALNAFDGPVIEVHISNVHKREDFRHHSFVSLRADGVIAGCGTEGYRLGLRRVASLTAT